jgi:hypothetical protein
VRTHRGFLLLLLALAALVAGCGKSSSGGSGGGDGRAQALSYLPKGSPAVIEITTDPSSGQIKSLLGLVHKFPGASLLLGQLTDQLTKGTKINWNRDVKPALGNPFVLSPVSVSSSDFVGAIVAKDAGKAKAFVTTNGAKVGSREGVDLYKDKQDATTFYGLKDATVVFADGQPNLLAAIDRHAKGTGAKPGDAGPLTTGLPKDALVKVYGLVAPVIAHSAGTAQARRVPFVNALKGYGVTLSSSGSGLSVDFRVDTTNASLPASEQPLAAGGQPIGVTSIGPIDVGVRDVSHVVQYAEHLGQVLAPRTFPQFAAGLQAIKARTGVDVDRDFIGQLGDAVIATDTRLFAVRVKAKDTAALAGAVRKLRPIIPAFLQGAGLPGLQLGAGTGGLTLLGRGNHYVAGYGMVGDQLVLGTAAPAQLIAFAGQATKPVGAANDAVAFHGTTRRLAELILPAVAPAGLAPLAGPFLSRLGDITGSATETAAAITGHLSLPVK